jgi:FkbM family methyltransferase
VRTFCGSPGPLAKEHDCQAIMPLTINLADEPLQHKPKVAHAMLNSSGRNIRSKRTIGKIRRALFERRHYVAVKNILFHHTQPIDFLGRYLFAFGGYPCMQAIRFGRKELTLHAYSLDDVLTINEIFFRKDYVVSGKETIIVDFGSNIGFSAMFFLSAAERSFCYLFEPLPINTVRLKQTLAGFEHRYKLVEAAVALNDGQQEFGFEETGRYGGIGIRTGSYMTVQCVDAIRILEDILSKHGAIDILKIDIEALEKEILGAIPPQVLANIRTIFVEQTFDTNPLIATHNYIQYGSVAQFFRKR